MDETLTVEKEKHYCWEFHFLARLDTVTMVMVRNLWAEGLQRGREINLRSPEVVNGTAQTQKRILLDKIVFVFQMFLKLLL